MSQENQPTPGQLGERRNCSNCAFSSEVREPPPSIRKVRVCMYNPPQVVPIYSPQGVTLQVMHPPVNETLLCNQHRFRAEIANAIASAIASPTGGPPN